MITVRCTPELRASLKALASQTGRTLNALCIHLLRVGPAEVAAPEPAPPAVCPQYAGDGMDPADPGSPNPWPGDD